MPLDDDQLTWLAFARDRRDGGDPEPFSPPEDDELRRCPECQGDGFDVFGFGDCSRCQGRGES